MLTTRASRLALTTVLAAIAAAPAIAPNASAAQRFANPAGQPAGACTAADPCSIKQAIGGAQAGDEVIVATGNYQLTQNLFAPGQITIHGVAGQPRPRLLFSGPGQFGMTVEPGTTLRYLEVDQQQTVGASAIKTNSATLEQVVATGSANGATAAMRGNSTIRNSVVVASAPGLPAISATGGTSTLRNVTAIATGTGSAAISASAGVPVGTVTVHATNVIARGGPGGKSLLATTDSSGPLATLTMRHSSWMDEHESGTNAKIEDAGGNQHSAPAFVGAATRDYRQAAGSPTIDAGLSDQLNGDFDLDGDPRVIATTDIGADEFVPPQPPPAPPPPSPSPTPVPQPPPTQPFAGVELVSSRLTYARRAITARLRCPAATVGRCSGRTKLTARVRRTSARRVTLGRAAFSIAPGNRVRVKVRVTRAGRRLLNRTPRLRGRAVNVARDAAGQSKTIRAAVTVRRRHR